MSTWQVRLLATTALLLGIGTLAAAHGGEHEEVNMPLSTAPVPNPEDAHGEMAQSYWRMSEHANLMYWHIGLEILAWLIILPVAVMFSIARSRWTMFLQPLFLLTNTSALIIGAVFRDKSPELYENDAHSKTGSVVSWIAGVWVAMTIVNSYARKGKIHPLQNHKELGSSITVENLQRVQETRPPHFSRWSNDSGQGTERNSESLFSRSSIDSEEKEFTGPTRRWKDEEDNVDNEETETHGFLGKETSSLQRFLVRHSARFAVGWLGLLFRLVHATIERTIIVQGLVAIATGTVVYGGLGKGGAIFNVLAHYIKGGIFFGYGLLTLGRWMGSFADFGWAWNVKPPKHMVGSKKFAMPSAEFVESFVIFLYGCTNVFLEHLAAWGDTWTPQDLEHVSISVMFFAGGLLGMIVESRRIRDLAVFMPELPERQHEELWKQPSQYRFSMNPMPALMILLLGKMMSSHHQESMLSTMVHSQWGGMFMAFSFARSVTYIVLYISPPSSILPSRPPSEVVTSFCLIAGGITFVLSNKDTIAALESYHVDAMFTFTVTMGLTALVMAWTTVLIAIKGWAARRV